MHNWKGRRAFLSGILPRSVCEGKTIPYYKEGAQTVMSMKSQVVMPFTQVLPFIFGCAGAFARVLGKLHSQYIVLRQQYQVRVGIVAAPSPQLAL